MNRHRTYRPPLPQIPADSLRGNPFDTRDPRSHVPPLKGLRETLTASGSYRASVPAGLGGHGMLTSHRALAPAADRQNRSFKALSGKGSAPATPPPFRPTPFRPRPRHTAPVWRNPGRHPHRDESFTFSAKEKDLETGLSYFGSRYYSSDLSIWLSVDPMSGKYPSTSSYAYCRNNPIILIDPDGEFDTRAEARQYRKEHHTGGIIKKNSGKDNFSGNYSIYNKREHVSYTKPQYVEDDASITMIGLSSDGVVKSPIAHDPRTTREKLDDFDRKAAQKGVAIGQGLVTALPITSQINDIMILGKGENMFGDKASKSDKEWAIIDLATLGVGKTLKLFEEAGGPVVRKAADIIEDVGYALNIRSWFMTTKNKWKNGKKKK